MSIYTTVTVPETEVEVEVDLDESELLEAVEDQGLGIEDFLGHMIFDEDDMAEYLLTNDHPSVVNSDEVLRLAAENARVFAENARMRAALKEVASIVVRAYDAVGGEE